MAMEGHIPRGAGKRLRHKGLMGPVAAVVQLVGSGASSPSCQQAEEKHRADLCPYPSPSPEVQSWKQKKRKNCPLRARRKPSVRNRRCGSGVRRKI